VAEEISSVRERRYYERRYYERRYYERRYYESSVSLTDDYRVVVVNERI